MEKVALVPPKIRNLATITLLALWILIVFGRNGLTTVVAHVTAMEGNEHETERF